MQNVKGNLVQFLNDFFCKIMGNVQQVRVRGTYILRNFNFESRHMNALGTYYILKQALTFLIPNCNIVIQFCFPSTQHSRKCFFSVERIFCEAVVPEVEDVERGLGAALVVEEDARGPLRRPLHLHQAQVVPLLVKHLENEAQALELP